MAQAIAQIGSAFTGASAVSNIGTAVSLFGIASQTQAAKQAAQFNERELQLEAQNIEIESKQREDQIRVEVLRQQARIRAEAGAGGVSIRGGSALSRQLEIAARGQRDIINLGITTESAIRSKRAQAGFQSAAARAAGVTGIVSAGSLLTRNIRPGDLTPTVPRRVKKTKLGGEFDPLKIEDVIPTFSGFSLGPDPFVAV